MNKREHEIRHVILYDALVELLEDYIICTGLQLCSVNAFDVAKWACKQAKIPEHLIAEVHWMSSVGLGRARETRP